MELRFGERGGLWFRDLEREKVEGLWGWKLEKEVEDFGGGFGGGGEERGLWFHDLVREEEEGLQGRDLEREESVGSDLKRERKEGLWGENLEREVEKVCGVEFGERGVL